MNSVMRTGIFVTVGLALCVPAAGGDLRGSLWPESISSVRINLNPWGPQIGFEIEVGHFC